MSFTEGAISEAAVNLCAAIAGREHGDARKAIDLLRVAGKLQKEKAPPRSMKSMCVQAKTGLKGMHLLSH